MSPAQEMFDALLDVNAVTIAYKPLGQAAPLNTGSPASLQAVRGKSILETREDDNLILQVPSNDFIVRRCDLLINGNPITPAKGDTITVTGERFATSTVYQLMTPPYSPVDHDGTLTRLHGKLLADVNPYSPYA